MSTNEHDTTRLTESQFAARVGWHEKTVAKYRRAGLIQHRGLGRRVWYLEEDVAAFHETFKRTPQHATS